MALQVCYNKEKGREPSEDQIESGQRDGQNRARGLKAHRRLLPLYAGAFAGHQVYVQGLSGAKGAGVLPLSVVL